MNVLSLFDGISCGQVALNRSGVKYDKYFAAEIDKSAIKVTQHNFPNTVQLGDVSKISGINLPSIDLIFGGSPCQGFSFAGKHLNFDDPRSRLFFEFVRLLKETKSKYFLLENVVMKQESQDIISQELGVKPVLINSSLLSAQMRKRLYWTNIPFTTPEDKGIKLTSVIEPGWFVDRDKSYCIDASYERNANLFGYIKKSRGQLVFDSHETIKFYRSLTRQQLLSKEIRDRKDYRRLTRIECERLQTLPEHYTDSVSDNAAKKCIGNGWTVDIIANFFKGLK